MKALQEDIVNGFSSVMNKQFLKKLSIFTALISAPLLHGAVLVINNAEGATNPFSSSFAETYFNTGALGPVESVVVENVFVNDITAADSYSPGVSVLDFVNSFDLVVFGNGVGTSTTAGSYDSDGWASVTAGILAIQSFAVRSDRFGWVANGSGNLNSAAGVETTVLGDAHPIFGGLGLTGNVDLFADSTPVLQTLASGAVGGTGEVLATVTGGLISIVAWETGGTLNSGDTVAGRRLYFAMNQNGWGDGDLTATGGDVFNAGVEWVAAIPEPSTYAVLSGLLALGFVIYRRRRVMR